MFKEFKPIFRPKPAERFTDRDFETAGMELKKTLTGYSAGV